MVGLQNALAQTVVDALADSGISQDAFAAMLGMSPKHVSQMLTGTTGGSLAVWNLMLFTVGADTVRIAWQQPTASGSSSEPRVDIAAATSSPYRPPTEAGE